MASDEDSHRPSPPAKFITFTTTICAPLSKAFESDAPIPFIYLSFTAVAAFLVYLVYCKLRLNLTPTTSLKNKFQQSANTATEKIATAIETVAEGLEDGSIDTKVRWCGVADYLLVVIRCFVYCVDQVLDCMVMVGQMVMADKKPAIVEVLPTESKFEVMVRELLQEWKAEDEDRANRKKLKAKKDKAERIKMERDQAEGWKRCKIKR